MRLVLPFKLFQSFLITTLFIFCLILPTRAAEVIRVDPNTPEAAASQEEPQDFWSNPRLSQPVTYEALRKPVRDILDDLTQLTGVKLNAGYNSNDWQVRDRRMVVIAKELPLKDLMQSIARVMKFKWSRTEHGGEWTYRLYMDRKTLLGEEAQRYREEQRENEYINKQREKLLNTIDRSEKLTSDELAKLRESEPYTYSLVKSGFASSFADLMREMPEVREAFLNREELRVRSKDMQPEMLGALMRIASAGKQIEFDASDSDAEHTDYVYFSINGMFTHLPEGEPMLRHLLGDVHVECDGFDVNIPLVCPDSSLGDAYGRLSASVVDGEMTPKAARTELSILESQDLYAKERASEDWGEPRVEHTEDSELAREVELKYEKFVTPSGEEYEKHGLQFTLSSLAEASNLSIVSDFFPETIYRDIPAGKRPIRTILDDIEGSYIRNWWKNGEVLELRDRYWYRKRAVQLPDSLIERWMNTFKAKGHLEMDDLAQICCLTRVQFTHNLRDIYVFHNLYQDSKTRNAFRFYASLSKAQKGMLLSKRGLDIRVLSPEQRGWLARCNPRLRGAEDVCLFAARSEEDIPIVDDQGKLEKTLHRAYCTFGSRCADESLCWQHQFTLPTCGPEEREMLKRLEQAEAEEGK